ncbi:cell division cycle and apoptosis regulator protein 1 isoform X2 [Anopheles darlingi]|uniref:cell division cycle and apoptosis regulator protein 1 isoform X2 n=1 Tax=Anopheles darlingi TaxID=43151 RepID=UPI002100412F|nr:cell division cycle and apoptosis regulator protein 1 isoform X2 [Anopheles darlingi]
MAFNQKNPPWQRNANHGLTNMQTIVSFPQAQPVYNPNIGLQQQQNISILPPMGMQQQQIYSHTVQYPAARTINAIGFQNQPQSQPAQAPVNQQNASKFNSNNRTYSGTGMVTKLQGEFGFIDDEVFFQKNACVKGLIPKEGDRVLFDASYNSNMPFKWNASRVQLLLPTGSNSSTSGGGASGGGSNVSGGGLVGGSGGGGGGGHMNTSGRGGTHGPMYNPVAMGSSDINRTRNRYSPPYKSPERQSHRPSNARAKEEFDEPDRRRRREDRDGERPYREKPRERSNEQRDKERSPRRSSPKRRRLRSVPRYMVQVPKHLLTIKCADILEMRRRYSNMYIPSDFFNTDIRWTESFLPNQPFSIRSPCQFHIMHKDVDPPNELAAGDGSLDPADADYLYSAKVMLMSTPPMEEFYEKCVPKGEDRFDDREERDYLHPTRLISFLVGTRGKNETMAIGGPWSPSLDGLDPHSDPTVLIRTAVRTCRALTGIDLSMCSHWYRFVELYYRRSETQHKGRLIPPRVETVVIFLPDVRSCLPTRLEWEQIRLNYQASLSRVINSSSSVSSAVESANQGVVKAKSQDDATVAVVTPAPSHQSSSPVPVTPSQLSSITNVKLSPAAGTDAIVAPSTTSAVTAETNPTSAATTAVANAAAEEATPLDTEAEEETGSTVTVAAETAAADTSSSAALLTIDDSGKKPTSGENVVDILAEYKKMKVAELKAQLTSRNLPTDGVKAVLLSRLSDAVVKEQQVQLREPQDKSYCEDDTMQSSPPTNLLPAEEILVTAEEAAAVIEALESPDFKQSPSTEQPAPASDGQMEVEITDNSTTEEKRKEAVTVTESSSKSTPPVKKIKLSDKDCQMLERRYHLPEKSHIIVHPSRIAKSGKFDCSVISLSVLLDYRPEDTKEYSFEVALFAELFNDMLARDFGFNIYKELCAMPVKKENDSVKKESGNATESGTVKEPLSESGKSNGDDSKTASTTTTAAIEKVEDGKKGPTEEREGRKRNSSRHGETDESRNATGKEKGRATNINSELLLSFLYFDVTHCGYIFEKDVEDIIYTIGLNLSRSQIRKIVANATVRDTLHYRKLAEKSIIASPTVEAGENVTDEDSNKKPISAGDPTSLSDTIDLKIDKRIDMDDFSAKIARGNTDYKLQLKESLAKIVHTLDDSNVDNSNTKQPIEGTNEPSSGMQKQSGFVEHKGSIIDVAKLLEQLKRTGAACENTEKMLQALQKQNAELIASNARNNIKIKELQADSKNLSRKLSDAEQSVRDLSKKNTEYYSTLNAVYDRVGSIVHKHDRKRASSNASLKRESSKEKTSRSISSRVKDSPAEIKKEEECKQKEKIREKSGSASSSVGRKEETEDEKQIGEAGMSTPTSNAENNDTGSKKDKQ